MSEKIDITVINYRNENESSKSRNHLSEFLLTKTTALRAPLLHEEVRAQIDTVHFASEASLLLNNGLLLKEEIVKSLLYKIFKDNCFKSENVQELINSASNALFINTTENGGDFLQFSKTIHGYDYEPDGTVSLDPCWLVCMASVPHIDRRVVGITTMFYPINLGMNNASLHILGMVLTPTKEKQTKSDMETSRNIAAVLADADFRQTVHRKEITEKEFRDSFLKTANKLHRLGINDDLDVKQADSQSKCFGRGILDDVTLKMKYYRSDYCDALANTNAIFKTIAAIFFIFFANLMPTIAFGMLNEENTEGKLNVVSGLISQMIGGVGFGLIGGQHLCPLLTTAPLSIIISVLYNIGNHYGYEFFSLYAWVGVFNSVYLCIYALSGVGRLIKYSRRSTEDTYSFFVAIAYIIIAVGAYIKLFRSHGSTGSYQESLLFVLLLLGTMASALWLHHFTNTPFLNSKLRKILTGFALPLSILVMSIIRSVIFSGVEMHNFNIPAWKNVTLHLADFHSLPLIGVLISASLAIPVSILIFIGHNIASIVVNRPSNKLMKGTSYHWDIVVLGVLNLVLSFLGLPWLHGAPLHASLYVASLATIEEHIDQSNHITQKVVKVVETRIPIIIANLTIGACVFLMPYPLLYISSPVLNGLFLYIAFRSIQNNQLFQRLLLLITEQAAYPPNHYLKRVPQRVVHLFTLIQSLQLIMLCMVGFVPYSYIQITFPVVLMFQQPFRHLILPYLISEKYLTALDKVT